MKLLVLASRPSDYVEMADLAGALAGRGHDVKLLYFYSTLQRAASAVALDAIRQLSQAGGAFRAEAIELERVTHPRPSGAAPALRTRESATRRLAAFARRTRLRNLLPVAARRFVVHLLTGARRGLVAHYEAWLAFYRSTIAAEQPDALLLPEDVVGYTWPTAIKAGHERGIPTLVFPYTLANRNEPLQSLRDEPECQTRHNRVMARRHPRWRLREGAVDLVRLPGAHIDAHERLGIAPPDPWMMNSGFANVICVDSQASYDYFLAGGIPASKMEITGSVSQDVMYGLRERRDAELAALREAVGLRGSKPLLLVSGCPNQLGARTAHCEFHDFPSIAAFVGACLQPLGAHYHLVVRPHPNFPEFGAMLAPFGFASVSMPTSRLVPLASLFVAFASATIRWAIASAVPTVNYDVFGYGYGDFARAAGVIDVDSRDAFRRAAAPLVPGSEPHRTLQALAQADSARWAMMDGRCLDRIDAAIRRECAMKPARRTTA